ncbi:SH3 domain-containing protein [Nitrobacter sp.]|uniref:SH3 domain-containing protein n=1 Tax=Nitrobacter sp. TaxID=29420 RepID=UPI0032207597
MRLAKGAQARCKTGLRLREGPGTTYAVEATLKADVLVRLLADPAGGWAQVEVNGHTLDGKTIYSEPDAASSVEATRGPAAEWRVVALTGYVATAHLTVEDGP